MSWLEDTDDEDARDRALFAAYKQAWQARDADSGHRSVLATAFERAGFVDVVRDPSSEEHEFWFAAWDEAVSPGKIGAWGVKRGLREVVDAGKELKSILRDRTPDWAELPKDVRPISRTNEAKTKSATLSVDLDPEPACVALLRDVLVPGREEKVTSWIDVREARKRAPLLVGDARLGWISDESALPRKTRWGKTFVPDGKVQVQLTETGQVELRKLKVRVWRKKFA